VLEHSVAILNTIFMILICKELKKRNKLWQGKDADKRSMINSPNLTTYYIEA
jgi:hypothetical protein